MHKETSELEPTWEPMRLASLGRVGDVVQKAFGKSPTTSGDSGEPDRKPSGGE
jgi:hypothetical protein